MSTEKTTLTVFDANDYYTPDGVHVSAALRPLCHQRINELLSEGHNFRTAMVVGSTPTVPAENYNVDPLEFHALWMLEIYDICLERILDGRR